MAGAGSGPGVVHCPWYATGFRGDAFETALAEIARVALRYGATEYELFRSRDDRYRFLQIAYFDDQMDWERYWHGPELVRFRAVHAGWYQVPVLYVWHDLVGKGVVAPEPAAAPAPVS